MNSFRSVLVVISSCTALLIVLLLAKPTFISDTHRYSSFILQAGAVEQLNVQKASGVGDNDKVGGGGGVELCENGFFYPHSSHF